MAKKDLTKCADCGQTGGRMTWKGDDRYVHTEGCGGQIGEARGEKAFPFTTNHITGKPVVVENLRQLRKLESQHGLANIAFNENRSNW